MIAGFHAELSGTASGLHEAGEQWAADHYGIGVHEHPGVELYLQVHGTTHWQADGTLDRLAPGQLLVVPPRTRHALAGQPSRSTSWCSRPPGRSAAPLPEGPCSRGTPASRRRGG